MKTILMLFLGAFLGVLGCKVRYYIKRRLNRLKTAKNKQREDLLSHVARMLRETKVFELNEAIPISEWIGEEDYLMSGLVSDKRLIDINNAIIARREIQLVFFKCIENKEIFDDTLFDLMEHYLGEFSKATNKSYNFVNLVAKGYF